MSDRDDASHLLHALALALPTASGLSLFSPPGDSSRYLAVWIDDRGREQEVEAESIEELLRRCVFRLQQQNPGEPA